MSLVVGLSPVLLARLLGLRLSGVVNMLLICPGWALVWSKIPLSPLLLRPDKFWVKVGIPGAGTRWGQAAKLDAAKRGVLTAKVRSRDEVGAAAPVAA